MTFPWPENFPRVLAMTSGRKLVTHPDHAAAKAGDMDSAARLVMDLAPAEKIRALAAAYPGAIVAAVHAQESGGINEIPAKFADYIGHLTGLVVDTEIIQSNTVFRTGRGGWYRMAFRPEFEGDVAPGRDYILVDDCVTGGGSLSEMRQHVCRGGGEVVACSTIGYAQFSTNLAISNETQLALQTKYGTLNTREWLKENNLYNGEIGALTESEGRLLRNAGGLVEAGKRLSEARQEVLAEAQPVLFQEFRTMRLPESASVSPRLAERTR